MQRGQVLDWLADNRYLYTEALREAVGPTEFDRIWHGVADSTSGPMADALDEMAEQATEHGYRAASRDVRMGLSFDLANPRAVAFLEQFGARRVTGLNRTTHAAMRNLLTQGVDQGWSYQRTARQIREQFDGFTSARAEMVAVTETADAYEHGQWMVRADLADQGIATEVAWLAESDACEICSPNPGDGYLPADGVFSSGHTRPPAHPRCIPAGAIVSGPRALASTARWYDGEVVDIELRGGNRLTVTPNHPVLSPQGWVAAGALHEGGQVVRSRRQQRVPPTIDPHDRQEPALIENVARALGGARSVSTVAVPTAAEDFHGDGAGSEVAVVRTDRLLGHRRYAAFGKPSGQHRLCLRHAQAASLPRRRDLASVLPRQLDAACDVVRCVAVATILLGTALLHHQPVGLRRTPQINAPVTQGVGDGPAAYPVPLRQDVLRYAGEVVADEVVRVGRRPFRGHVYNLETGPGWYISNGIVTHNCRCATITRVAERSRVAPNAPAEPALV